MSDATETTTEDTQVERKEPPKPVRSRMFLYSQEAPGGKLFEGEGQVRAALESGWVDHPGKVKRKRK